MPHQSVNGIHLYYEWHGAPAPSSPVALFMGLGGNLAMWDRELIDGLAAHHRVLLFENRGTGRSDKPDSPCSIAMFADDAAALFAALGIERAHVLGASMGGMIAQQFALAHPQRVARLALCCTTAGGPDAVPPEEEVLHVIANTEGLAPGAAARASRRVAFHPTSLTPEMVAYLDRKLVDEVEFPTPPFALAHHFSAAVHFNVADRVHTIAHPTLVLAGREDRMVPAANSLWLAQRIPNADLIMYGNAGHAFMTERRDEVVRDLLEFFARE